MKKAFSVLILVFLLVSLIACGGGKKPSEAYLGLGHVATLSAEEADASGCAELTVAAAVVDGESGALIDCAIDLYSLFFAVNELGRIDVAPTFISSAVTESAEYAASVEALAASLVGKSAAELPALAEAEEDPLLADAILAVERAMKSASSPCKRTDAASVALVGKNPSAVPADFYTDTNGSVSADVYFAAASIDAENKIGGAAIDTVTLSFSFNASGHLDKPSTPTTKRELGYGYNMKPFSPIGLEWFEQVEYFCEFLRGKTAADLEAVRWVQGNPDLVSGCTIYAGDLFAAAIAVSSIGG